MIIATFDVGVSTGWCVYDTTNKKRVNGGTINAAASDGQALFDYVFGIIEKYQPLHIVVENPVVDKNNNLASILSKLITVVSTASVSAANAYTSDDYQVILESVKPAMWKPSPFAKKNFPYWKGRKITQHEKDASRMAMWYANTIPS